MKKIMLLMLAISLAFGCNLPNQESENVESKNLKIKNYEENEAGASSHGMSSNMEDVSSVYAKRSIKPSEQSTFNKTGGTDSSNNWIVDTPISGEKPSSGTYEYNNGYPYPDIQNKFTSNHSRITYGNGLTSWLNYISGGQNYDYNNGYALVIENDSVGESYSPLYYYNNNTQSQNWQAHPNMSGGWQTYSPFTYNRGPGSKIEFKFTGTNVHIQQRKASNRGVCDIKVFKDSDNSLVASKMDLDLYSTSVSTNITKFEAFKSDNYRVEISFNSISPNAPDQNDTFNYGVFDFDKASVYPSIEYKLSSDDLNSVKFLTNNKKVFS